VQQTKAVTIARVAVTPTTLSRSRHIIVATAPKQSEGKGNKPLAEATIDETKATDGDIMVETLSRLIKIGVTGFVVSRDRPKAKVGD